MEIREIIVPSKNLTKALKNPNFNGMKILTIEEWEERKWSIK